MYRATALTAVLLGLFLTGLVPAQDQDPFSPFDRPLTEPSSDGEQAADAEVPLPDPKNRAFNRDSAFDDNAGDRPVKPSIDSVWLRSDAPTSDTNKDDFGTPASDPELTDLPATIPDFGRGQRVDRVTQIRQKIQQLTEELRETATDKREPVVRRLRLQLDELFDAHTLFREHNVRNLEQRIGRLRTQLNERKDRKKHIVDLRLQTLVNEASGLTF